MIFQLPKPYWAILFACLSMFALGLSDNIRGPLFPELLTAFGISNSAGSLSFALASAAAFSATVLSSSILKRINLDRMLLISLILMGVGLFVVGSADHFYVYLIGVFLYGFSLGSTGVAQNLLIAENVDKQIQTKALAGLHSIYGLSSFLAPILAANAASHTSVLFPGVEKLAGWQSAFFVTACMSLMVCLFIICTRVEPKFIFFEKNKNDLQTNNKFNLKFAILMSGFFATYVGAEILVSTRLALYMRTYHDMNLEQSSRYVTYFFVFLLVGRLAFTMINLKWKLKTQLNLSLLFSAVLTILGLWYNPFFLTLIGLAMAPFYPLAVVYISELTGFEKRKYLTFVMSAQGLLVISMHLGVGYLTDTFGLFFAFSLVLLLLGISTLCLNLNKLYPKKAE
jgi:FHS family glucose/mannose:H+ symporter-like MFS transporter